MHLYHSFFEDIQKSRTIIMFLCFLKYTFALFPSKNLNAKIMISTGPLPCDSGDEWSWYQDYQWVKQTSLKSDRPFHSSSNKNFFFILSYYFCPNYHIFISFAWTIHRFSKSQWFIFENYPSYWDLSVLPQETLWWPQW